MTEMTLDKPPPHQLPLSPQPQSSASAPTSISLSISISSASDRRRRRKRPSSSSPSPSLSSFHRTIVNDDDDTNNDFVWRRRRKTTTTRNKRRSSPSLCAFTAPAPLLLLLLLFAAAASSTTATSLRRTSAADTLTCGNIANGMHPTYDCKGYYRCANGKYVNDNVIFDCPSSTLFDVDAGGFCNWEYLVDCKHTAPPTPSPPPTREPTRLPTTVKPTPRPQQMQTQTMAQGVGNVVVAEPNVVTAPPEFEYLGCYLDDASSNALPLRAGGDEHTVAECAYYCRSEHPTSVFFGRQGRGTCYCGTLDDNYARYGPPADGKCRCRRQTVGSAPSGGGYNDEGQKQCVFRYTSEVDADMKETTMTGRDRPVTVATTTVSNIPDVDYNDAGASPQLTRPVPLSLDRDDGRGDGGRGGPGRPVSASAPGNPGGRPPSEPVKKTIIGYYAAWQYYDREKLAIPANMDFTKVTRVNFAFFQINEQGDIWGTDSWADPAVLFGPRDWTPVEGQQQYCMRVEAAKPPVCAMHKYEEGLISRAHEAGAEVYPSIGGWTLSDPFPAMAANSVARVKFADNCIRLIEELDFDGIDIDWEYPGYEAHSGTTADRGNWNLLLDELRRQLDLLEAKTGKHYGLTAALPCGPEILAKQDIAHVSSVLSELNLMTYDFHGSWNTETGSNAPLYDQGYGDPTPRWSVHGCVENFVDGGADPSKINIGLPFYGRSFRDATGINEEHRGSDEDQWFEDDGAPQFFNIFDKLNQMTSFRDEVSMTQYASFNDGSGLVSYDDEEAICDKTQYAIDHELNGYIIWELSGDIMPDLSTPLLDAVHFKQDNPNTPCSLVPRQTMTPTASPVVTPPPSLAPILSPTRSPTRTPTPDITCDRGETRNKGAADCSGYIMCVHGSIVGGFNRCGAGMLFDSRISNCNWQSAVSCNSESDDGD